jgi:hypothetical protein
MASADEAFFVKTLDLPRQDRHPAVYLVRDGRDALVSYARFTLVYDHGLPPEAITDALFRRTLVNLMLERRSRFGTWAVNVNAWLARPGTLPLRFEDAIARPAYWAGHVIEALGIPLTRTGEAPPTFEELHRTWPQFFRRGKVGSWRDEFPPELLDTFWKEFGATMRRLGYR